MRIAHPIYVRIRIRIRIRISGRHPLYILPRQERELIEELVSFQCPASEYNEVASLYMTDSDTAIKQLFHFREDGAKDQQTFSSSALFIFWFPYLSMACLTYGLAVPSGLFVPSLLSGAALGRLVGHTLHKIDGASGTFADSGTYALVGAAAGLGGMARMTISLAVILLEATGDMQYVLPLMLSLMAARYAGNMFNDGLYDVHIKLKRIPFLDAELPSTVQHAEIKAMHVMSIECITLPPIEKVSVIQDMLLRCEHDCFPVTDPSHGHILVGTILRKVCSWSAPPRLGPPSLPPFLLPPTQPHRATQRCISPP